MLRASSQLAKKRFSSYLIRNGTVVTASHAKQADVLLRDGVVAEIGAPGQLDSQSGQRIEAGGKLVIPGGIDTHTHMQMPFMGTHSYDDFESGSLSCLAGGTTSFLDFVIPGKGQSILKAYETWRGWADPKVHCDYSLHCALTHWSPDVHREMADLVRLGVQSFKFFMAYKGALMLEEEHVLKAFERAKELGAICLVHAENGELIEHRTRKVLEAGVTGPEGHYLSRPPYIEADAVARVIAIAQTVNNPLYVVHVMSKEAAEAVSRAKQKGLVLYAETLAAALGTDGANLWHKDWDVASRYVMSPPLGPDRTVKKYLMQMLQAGVLEVVGTDNCTFCTSQKRMGLQDFSKIPNGVNGLEDRLSVVWTRGVATGLLSPSQFVEAVATKAAKIFNMYPKKGEIAIGSDADIVVWDHNAKRTISCKTHHQKVDFNVFQGQTVFGKASYSFSKGKMVWDGEKIISQPGNGKFVPRSPFGFSYERIANLDKANDFRRYKVDRSEGTAPAHQPATNNTAPQSQCQSPQLYKDGQITSIQSMFKKYIPSSQMPELNRLLYGTRCCQLQIASEIAQTASSRDYEVRLCKVASLAVQQTRPARWVRIAAIQNKMVLPADAPVQAQKQAIMERIVELIEGAVSLKANVVCLQEIWNSPFFLCTREKYPWLEFAEPVEGESTQLLKQLSRQHNLVIISPILELDSVSEVYHNSALVIERGEVVGKQHKNHIPRVGDFNESTYYMEGQTGFRVFETAFGKIGVNICYGRHHPLCWMAYALNGAEVIVNPSATVHGTSESLWSIEARNAAIANHVFTVGINRVGTERYPNPFTSGDGKAAKHEFGHFYGSSYLAAPDGSRTPGLSRVRDGVLVSEIDLNMCRQVKSHWGFAMTARFDTYADLLAKFVRPGFEPNVIKK